MGVYIEGFEKPKNCWTCPCYETGMAGQYPACCKITDKGVKDIYDKPPGWCPMREMRGGEVIAFTCDRKKECNTSPICGTECTQTFDKEHAVFEEGLWVFT